MPYCSKQRNTKNHKKNIKFKNLQKQQYYNQKTEKTEKMK
jgi:hypothetical protein